MAKAKLIVSGRVPESVIPLRNTKSTGYAGYETVYYFECAWCGCRALVPTGKLLGLLRAQFSGLRSQVGA